MSRISQLALDQPVATRYRLRRRLNALVPYAFIGVVVLAVCGDLWLYRSRSGLAKEAQKDDEGAQHEQPAWYQVGDVKGAAADLGVVGCGQKCPDSQDRGNRCDQE